MGLSRRLLLVDFAVPDDGMPSDLAHFYFRQLLSAVRFLQRTGIVHRDLKPENVLVDSFGACHPTHAHTHNQQQTRERGVGLQRSFPHNDVCVCVCMCVCVCVCAFFFGGVDMTGNVKIADFGFATLFRNRGKERPLRLKCGTPPYVAPEVRE